jgi:hypothetical protein
MEIARKRDRWLIAIVVAIAIGGFLMWRDSATQPGQSAAGTQAQVIPGSNGMTLAQLNSSASAQITGHKPRAFGVHGVKSVTCNPPKSWSDGNTFTCYVYGRYGRVLGTYTGTITPDQGSNLTWNGQWVPTGLGY